jgi:GDPmannose 4,6-dehydratase
MTRKALVLGVTGQDGSYLAEVLLEKGYEVHGMVRRSATGNTRNIQHLIDDPKIFNQQFFLCRGDLADPTSLYRIITQIKPQEIYNEADQDHVGWSYDMVGFSADITGAAVGRLLEIIRQIDPGIRYFQPCTSNMFGKTDTAAQNEETPFNPQSPYACAKLMAYHFTRYYRDAFGMFASTAILYNHESPRRTEEYLTRKVTRGVARIARGQQQHLMLGDLSARIDWGYSREFMAAAWSILQAPAADDFVIGTGEAHAVQEWVNEAFAIVGLDPAKHVRQDERFMRPTRTSPLVADISKARRVIGFNPKITFKPLVRLMVEVDLREADGGAGG